MLAPNQSWTYRAPNGFENSRLVIGAILSCADQGRIVCFSAHGVPGRDANGSPAAVTIPFLPMTEEAFMATALAEDGCGDPAPGFSPALNIWSQDPQGLSVFTVHFDGHLDRLIARQMAELIEAGKARTAA